MALRPHARARPRVLALAGALLFLAIGAPGAAGDEAGAAQERKEAAERHAERGWKAFRSGNHEEVLARMERVERYDPSSPLPAYLRGRVGERTGQY
ncbi:MAG: hypothetical protein ACC662_02160, partial [Planctomycetota bacterium]